MQSSYNSINGSIVFLYKLQDLQKSNLRMGKKIQIFEKANALFELKVGKIFD